MLRKASLSIPPSKPSKNQRLKAPGWNYLCLSAEIQEPGDFVVTRIAEVPIILARNQDDEIVRPTVNVARARGLDLTGPVGADSSLAERGYDV